MSRNNSNIYLYLLFLTEIANINIPIFAADYFRNSSMIEKHYIPKRWQNIAHIKLHTCPETLVRFLLLYTTSMSNASNERYIDLSLKNSSCKIDMRFSRDVSKNVIYEFSEYSMTYDENSVVCIVTHTKASEFLLLLFSYTVLFRAENFVNSFFIYQGK